MNRRAFLTGAAFAVGVAGRRYGMTGSIETPRDLAAQVIDYLETRRFEVGDWVLVRGQETQIVIKETSPALRYRVSPSVVRRGGSGKNLDHYTSIVEPREMERIERA